MSPPDPERYEPMPSLLEIPGWLLRKLPRRTRIVATALLVALVVGGLVAVVLVALPAENRRSRSQRRLEQRQLAARLAQVRRLQRPRPFRLRRSGSASAVARAVEARVAGVAGTRRARCRLAPSGPPLTFACDAIRASNTLNVVSLPYQAHVGRRGGRGALCRIIPPPSVPTDQELRSYRIPRACGGLGA